MCLANLGQLSKPCSRRDYQLRVRQLELAIGRPLPNRVYEIGDGGERSD